MATERTPPAQAMLPRRQLAAAISAAVFVLAASTAVEQVSVIAAVVFGLLVARPAALWLALAPFFLKLPDADGSGEPPDWIAGLVFETPMYALFIAVGVLAVRLGRWGKHHSRKT